MKNYEEAINKLAEDKYEDRKMGLTVNRFEGLKITAHIFELSIKQVLTDVEQALAAMPGLDPEPIDYKNQTRKTILKGIRQVASMVK
jgi:hypothetical protein